MAEKALRPRVHIHYGRVPCPPCLPVCVCPSQVAALSQQLADLQKRFERREPRPEDAALIESLQKQAHGSVS